MRATLASPETPQPIAGTSGTAVTSVAQSEEQVSSRYLDLTRRKLELTRLPHLVNESKSASVREQSYEVVGNADDGDDNDDERWRLGVPKETIEPDIDYWQGESRLERYDWRERERYFNARLPQFRTAISATPNHAALRLHFVHKRRSNVPSSSSPSSPPPSPASNAIPLLYCHNWPGGIIEVARIIDHLTQASADDEPAFDVVVPSIPGCGFSEPLRGAHGGPTVQVVAEIFDQLMARLGYHHYVAHGTGWGFDICRMLAMHHSSRCLATHTTTPLPYLQPPSLTHRPLLYFKYLAARLMPHTAAAARLGYHPEDFPSHSAPPQRSWRFWRSWRSLLPFWRRQRPQQQQQQQQRQKQQRRHHPNMLHSCSTACGGAGGGRVYPRTELGARPRTLSYALCDSPVGLLAWTREALHARTRGPDSVSTDDALDFTMLSWLPGPEAPLRYLAATAANAAEVRQLARQWSSTPLGLSVFPDSRGGGGSSSSSGGAANMRTHRHWHMRTHTTPPAWAGCVQPLASVIRHHGADVGWPVWERPAELAQDLKIFVRSPAVAMRRRTTELSRQHRADDESVAGLGGVD